MIVFNSGCFNSDYLKAIQIARLNLPIIQTRVGEVALIGQAMFIISPNDPRLIFLKDRNLNYLFAIKESIWVLSGSNDLDYLKKEIKHYGDYSDDGKTLNGAYGFRLRKYFSNKDQLEIAIKQLSKDKNSRRIVLSMYSPDDLDSLSKDIPCNTTIYLKIINDKLDLTTLNRSNDLFLGLPYNIFIFGILQKYIAMTLNIEVGKQRHFTDNLHLYTHHFKEADNISKSNHVEEIEKISRSFDWSYSTNVIQNKDHIFKEEYDLIEEKSLSSIMSNHQLQDQTDEMPDNGCFLSFLIREKHARIKKESNEAEASTMQISSQIELKSSLWLPEDELNNFILATSEKLLPNEGKIVDYLNQKSTILKISEKASNIQMHTIIISAILSQLDPLISNTEFGQSAKKSIFSVAQKNGIIETLPLGWFDNTFFDILDSLI